MKDLTDPEGLVFVHGEYWRAKAKEKLEPEDEADGLDGLVLEVKRATNQGFLTVTWIGFLDKYKREASRPRSLNGKVMQGALLVAR